MADSSPASFLTQADALLRKNLVFQKRNIWNNVRLITIRFFLCQLLLVVQMLFDTQFNGVHGQCGCKDKTCSLRYSTSEQAAFCAIPNPPQWTPLLRIPAPRYRAATPYPSHSSPATFLFTGNNQSLGKISILMKYVKVVYMDEPSTGLDPASRKSLWNVVKRAKRKGAIILTTHSMEEAEVLCDRLGMFVDGSFQCIGNPKELKGRYGGSYVLTVTTSEEHEHISENAKKIHRTAGTQKFELPKQEVKIAEVFQAVEKAKMMFPVVAWGLADTTLEDGFVMVAQTS